MQTILNSPEQFTLPLLVVLVLVVLILLFRKPPVPQQDPQLIEDLSQSKANVQHLQLTLSEATTERDKLRDALSQEQKQTVHLQTMRDNLNDRLERMEAAHAQTLLQTESMRKEVLQKHEGQLGAEKTEAAQLREANGKLTTNNGVLQESLETQRKKHEELKAETEANHTQFVNHFKTISSELLQNQGKATTEAQKNELEKLLTPFKQELGFLKSGIKDMSEKAEKERGTLGQQIQMMQEKATELSAQANSLTLALRGDRKRQGNWGETILERIL